ncbi:unnamed protein product [Prorocentrum cordatum]|uniref:Uncharacterized protein n=1 Tax=Prorocentrum cordatum TaxID=2364126 RepID=A0ABN9VFU1_9DINO|nr:unnamed protein product [Polarella glacialis]
MAKLASALQTVTGSIGSLQLADGDAIAKHLEGAPSALKETPITPVRSRAARLAEAASELEDTNKKYRWAFEQKDTAEKKAEKKKQKSIFEQLLDTDTDLLSPSEAQTAEVEQGFACDEDMGAEGRKVVEEAKKQVLAQLQLNARTFACQLKEHIVAAKKQAEAERAQISQAHKKRKAEDAAQDGTTTGSTISSQRVTPAQGDEVEPQSQGEAKHALQEAGISAASTAARAGERGESGTCGAVYRHSTMDFAEADTFDDEDMDYLHDHKQASDAARFHRGPQLQWPTQLNESMLPAGAGEFHDGLGVDKTVPTAQHMQFIARQLYLILLQLLFLALEEQGLKLADKTTLMSTHYIDTKQIHKQLQLRGMSFKLKMFRTKTKVPQQGVMTSLKDCTAFHDAAARGLYGAHGLEDAFGTYLDLEGADPAYTVAKAHFAYWLWQAAAEHCSGKGLEHGADATDMRKDTYNGSANKAKSQQPLLGCTGTAGPSERAGARAAARSARGCSARGCSASRLGAMSGFERSAPIPGSQGPRRSQMHRFNNAPPPNTPWREEVLRAKAEAQKIIEREEGKRPAADRSRSRERGERERRKADKPTAAASSRAPDAPLVMRQARERGEGWFAAVARASEKWDTAGRASGKGGPKAQETAPSREPAAPKKEKPPKAKEPAAEKQRREEGEPRKDERQDRDSQRLDEARRERERAERLARAEFERKAEERSRKADEEKRRAEEERSRKEQLEKDRKTKLKGAFAMNDDDEDEDDRHAALARKAAEKKKAALAEVAVAAAGKSGGPDLSAKLRFEPGLSPAEAFMRLQERKRKGRRAEFGGPPRGCSPWRDGKRGISFEEGENDA